MTSGYCATAAVAALTLLAACATPPPPPTPVTPLTARVVNYTCAGSKHTTVAYGTTTATVAGETLVDDGAGHYSWPAAGTHHVWALDGAGLGTLSIHDSVKGTDTVVMTGCKADAG